jgi:uncharacterized protein (DUF736 family)
LLELRGIRGSLEEHSWERADRRRNPSPQRDARAPAASIGLIWRKAGFASTASPAMAVCSFFPPPDGFASRSKKAAARHPPLRCGPVGCGGGRPPPVIAIEAAMGAGSILKRRDPMATIGAFTKASTGYIGKLQTLTLDVKAKLVLAEKGDKKAPDFRLFCNDVEAGAAWKKTSREGRVYLSVKIDDPTFPAPIFANLFEGEEGEHALIWSRRSGD